MNNQVTVHIEISKNDNVKYEFDHDTHELVCDRILHVPMVYPFNYGYVPKTLSLDGDPIDAVVLCKPPLHPTCHIRCKIIGVLVTEDEKGGDDKLILVPCDEVDPRSKDINDICDVPNQDLIDIKYFFSHYKELEEGKFVLIKEVLGKDDAVRIYNESVDRYHNN
jgi:inorganic pyrophosphatase